MFHQFDDFEKAVFDEINRRISSQGKDIKKDSGDNDRLIRDLRNKHATDPVREALVSKMCDEDMAVAQVAVECGVSKKNVDDFLKGKLSQYLSDFAEYTGVQPITDRELHEAIGITMIRREWFGEEFQKDLTKKEYMALSLFDMLGKGNFDADLCSAVLNEVGFDLPEGDEVEFFRNLVDEWKWPYKARVYSRSYLRYRRSPAR